MKQIILGLLSIAAGISILRHVSQVKAFVGDLSWAERYLGSGGTYLALKLFGIGLAFGGFLYMTGTLDIFVQNTIGSIFPK